MSTKSFADDIVFEQLLINRNKTDGSPVAGAKQFCFFLETGSWELWVKDDEIFFDKEFRKCFDESYEDDQKIYDAVRKTYKFSKDLVYIFDLPSEDAHDDKTKIFKKNGKFYMADYVCGGEHIYIQEDNVGNMEAYHEIPKEEFDKMKEQFIQTKKDEIKRVEEALQAI